MSTAGIAESKACHMRQALPGMSEPEIASQYANSKLTRLACKAFTESPAGVPAGCTDTRQAGMGQEQRDPHPAQ